MMDDNVGQHSKYRLFEWVMAIAMLGFGVLLFIFPGSILVSRFANVVYLIPPSFLTVSCLFIGIGRVLVLYLNGKLGRFGAPLRGIFAFLSAGIWAQLSAALLDTGPAPAPTIPVYVALVLGEVRSIWRAARDANGLPS